MWRVCTKMGADHSKGAQIIIEQSRKDYKHDQAVPSAWLSTASVNQ